ncbi:MAG: RNA-binding S4 domain-containing protein [Rhodoferax sp.]
MSTAQDTLRIDKWLWAARFFKTRSLAAEALRRGQVQVGVQDAKPSRELRVGDRLTLRQGACTRTVLVLALSAQRGPAALAQLLYQESAESVQQRLLAQERARLSPEPAHSLPHGRPTKRDRRDLEQTWDARWSASIDR